ncbi:MAG: Ig-like domain-containing domain [Cyclobacteriaceae bacterium]
MRSILLAIICVCILNQLFHSCASPSTINGGPQDTIPPVLLEANPPNGKINFRGTTVELIFSEDINASKLKQELIITPFFENEYKYVEKKQTILIEFEKPFPDSTTFILNFADGIGDLNENNAVVNLKYAFSTGSFIDSLTVSGYIYDLMTNEPAENYLISLYDQDTSSVFEHKPTYFAYADKEGLFTIENIKSGAYHVYTFDDENKNLILESTTEKHGLLADTLNLDTASIQLEIPVILQDASNLTLVRERSQANRFDVRYSKYIHDFQIVLIDSSKTDLDRNLVENNEVIRFYPSKLSNADSTGYYITTMDSLGTTISDTLSVKFEGNNARLEVFEATLRLEQLNGSTDTVIYRVTANKPIKLFDPTLISFTVDSVKIPFLLDDSISYTTNRLKTELTFKVPKLFSMVSQYLDTLTSIMTSDTTRINQDSVFAEQVKYYEKLPRDRYELRFGEGWLISIEKDSAESSSINMTTPTVADVGLVRGSIYTTEKSYFIELIDKDGRTITTLNNPRETYEFKNVQPGKYRLRVKIDKNEDGQWSYGNIRKHTAPEPVFYMEEFFDVRANWELEGIDLSF